MAFPTPVCKGSYSPSHTGLENTGQVIFATKPYLCGSSYLIKMGDFGRGDWCDTVDGLYWRFVQDHAEVLSRNHRTAMMPRNLDRLSGARREKIFPAAEAFLAAKTRPFLS